MRGAWSQWKLQYTWGSAQMFPVTKGHTKQMAVAFLKTCPRMAAEPSPRSSHPWPVSHFSGLSPSAPPEQVLGSPFSSTADNTQEVQHAAQFIDVYLSKNLPSLVGDERRWGWRM